MYISDYPRDPQVHGSEPCTSSSGQILRRVIQQFTQDETGVAYGHAVRCRPVDRKKLEHARRPTATEARHCRANIQQDLVLMRPRQVVLLGLEAAVLLAQEPDGSAVDPKIKLGDLRGRDLHCTAADGTKIPAIVTFDHGFVQRNPTVGATWRDDLLRGWLRGSGRLPDDSRDGKVYTLDTIEKVRKFARKVTKLKRHDTLVLDYETESLGRIENKILTAGFAMDPDHAYVIPMQHQEAPWSGAEYREVKALIKQMLTRPAPYSLGGHNLKFEMLVTRGQLGFEIDLPCRDTMLRGHALNPDYGRVDKKSQGREESAEQVEDRAAGAQIGDFKLKTQVKECLNFHGYEDHDVAETVGHRNEASLATQPLAKVIRYNGIDCFSTYRLDRYQDVMAEALGYRKKLNRLCRGMHTKVLAVLVEMEINGIRVDKEYLRTLLHDDSMVQVRMQEISQEFFALPAVQEANRRLLAGRYGGQPGLWGQEAGESWVFSMTKAVAKRALLIDVLGLEPLKKTDKGVVSVDKKFLEHYQGVQEVDLLAEYTALATIKSRYLVGTNKAMMADPDCRDGRARAQFRPAGTITGRISAAGINVLNVPKKAEDGSKKASASLIKRMYICDPDHVMVCGDYSQAEVRWLAALTQDPSMLKAFGTAWDVRALCLADPSLENIKRLGGEGDFHKQTASMVYGVPVDKVSKEQRGKTKAVVFGQIYGQGLPALAAILKTTKAQTEEFIERFFSRFPVARDALKAMAVDGFENGFAESPTGRRKQFVTKMIAGSAEALQYCGGNLRSLRGREERVARNMPIQGISSDMNLTACFRIIQYYRRHRLPWRLINSVYDSIMLEVPRADAEQCCEVVQGIMEREDLLAGFGVNPGLRFLAEMSVGTNWGNQVDITAGDQQWKVGCRSCKKSREEKARPRNRRCEACGSTDVYLELIKGPHDLAFRWLDRQIREDSRG